MKPIKKIVIAGTHHTPAIELIKQLQKDDRYIWDVHYLAHVYDKETHLSHTIIPKLNVNFHSIECGKFDRRFPSITLKGIPKTLRAFYETYLLFSKIKPDLTISFGGYVSVPVCIISWLKHVPCITHEQTLTNSLSTKINSLFAQKIALSFNNQKQIDSLPTKKVIVTGNLIRSDIFEKNSKKFKALENVITKKPLIYITGGNQGSLFLNQQIVKILPKLRDFTIIHQTGKEKIEDTESLKKLYTNYYPVEYIEIEDIGWVLNKSQLVIGRSGANTCQEISLLRKNAIFIPHPYTQQNEQLLNAQWTQKQNPESIIIILQTELTSECLLEAIKKLSEKPLLSPQRTENLEVMKLIHEMV